MLDIVRRMNPRLGRITLFFCCALAGVAAAQLFLPLTSNASPSSDVMNCALAFKAELLLFGCCNHGRSSALLASISEPCICAMRSCICIYTCNPSGLLRRWPPGDTEPHEACRNGPNAGDGHRTSGPERRA